MDQSGRQGPSTVKPVSEYLIIKTEVLPEVFSNVMEVKALLQAGTVNSVNEAVKQVGMSRSAFYKYRDAVQSYQDPVTLDILTVVATLLQESDALADIILYLTKQGAKLLNISQSLPHHGFVDLMLSVDVSATDGDRVALRRELSRIPGVRRLELWSRDED